MFGIRFQKGGWNTLTNKLETLLNIGGYCRPFNDDINYPAMNSNALISIFHVSSHDMALEMPIPRWQGLWTPKSTDPSKQTFIFLDAYLQFWKKCLLRWISIVSDSAEKWQKQINLLTAWWPRNEFILATEVGRRLGCELAKNVLLKKNCQFLSIFYETWSNCQKISLIASKM